MTGLRSRADQCSATMTLQARSPAQPLLLRGPYFPDHGANRMRGEGDAASARRAFFERKVRNLDVLLEHRYGWMRKYLPPDAKIVEFGAGAGLTREYIRHPGLILTDVELRPWIDLQADALAPPFDSASIDCVICSQVIHHLANPARFLDLAGQLIKPGGYLLINEPEASLAMRCVLRLVRHEGWSFDVDPFDRSAVCNDTKDAWSGNNAVAGMLFRDTARFEANFPDWIVDRNEVGEFLIFLLSGGVTSKIFTIELPDPVLRLVGLCDRALTASMPSVFACGRQVALRRR